MEKIRANNEILEQITTLDAYREKAKTYEFDEFQITAIAKTINGKNERNYYAAAMKSENPIRWIFENPTFEKVKADTDKKVILDRIVKKSGSEPILGYGKLDKAEAYAKSLETPETIFPENYIYLLLAKLVRNCTVSTVMENGKKVFKIPPRKPTVCTLKDGRTCEIFDSVTNNAISTQIAMIIDTFELGIETPLITSKSRLFVMRACVFSKSVRGYAKMSEANDLRVCSLILDLVRTLYEGKEVELSLIK